MSKDVKDEYPEIPEYLLKCVENLNHLLRWTPLECKEKS
jgi:hypothetical protein